MGGQQQAGPAWNQPSTPAPAFAAPAQKSGWKAIHWVILGVAIFFGLIILAVVTLGFVGYEAVTGGVTKPNTATASPPDGWIDYTDPSGNFEANLPSQPIVQNGAATEYLADGDGFSAEVADGSLGDATPVVAYESALKGYEQKGTVLSHNSGNANGGSYEDVTIRLNDGSGVLEEARWFASKNHVYGLVVASTDQTNLDTAFENLCEGFTITPQG